MLGHVVSTQEKPRYHGVDNLRGVCVWLVMMLHAHLRYSAAGAPIDGWMPHNLSHLLLDKGDNSVTVFFAISGFLITLTSLQRPGGVTHMRWKTFYRLRMARILPPLLAVLGLLAGLDLVSLRGFMIVPQMGSLGGALWAALTLHFNWYQATHAMLPLDWQVLWSMSVTELFYLVFPVLCVLLLGRRPWGWVLFFGILLALIVAGPLARSTWATTEVWRAQGYLQNLDAVAMGCGTALLTHWLGRRGMGSRGLLKSLQVAGIAALLYVAVWPEGGRTLLVDQWLNRMGLRETVLDVASCMVMMASVRLGRPARRISSPVQWLGKLSYEVYLTHNFVLVGLCGVYVAERAKGHSQPAWLYFSALPVIALPLAWAFGRYFTEPLNRRLRGSRERVDSRPEVEMETAAV